MRAGVVDVGANTVRLLVADLAAGRVRPLRVARARSGLGADVEREGAISDRKLEAVVASTAAFVRRARKDRCATIEVLVTSPGRQARNGPALVAALAAATRVPCRTLSAEEEGELAWRAAVDAAEIRAGSVAVCDVGGGSTQIAVGPADEGPAWIRSVDLGSLRLTRRAQIGDRAAPGDVDRATRLAAEAFADLAPPVPDVALATGGTARNLRRIVGEDLDADALDSAVRRLAKRSVRQVVKAYGVDEDRARTLIGGALVLRAVRERLQMPLRVVDGGLREGAVLAALRRAQAAAS